MDTGATRLYLKPSVIKKLGLTRTDAVRSLTTNGDAIHFKYEPVELELMDRRETFDVIEVPQNVPNLLGQVPLEVLDLVVDPKRQRLIPNPDHGGEQMTEEYRVLQYQAHNFLPIAARASQSSAKPPSATACKCGGEMSIVDAAPLPHGMLKR